MVLMNVISFVTHMFHAAKNVYDYFFMCVILIFKPVKIRSFTYNIPIVLPWKPSLNDIIVRSGQPGFWLNREDCFSSSVGGVPPLRFLCQN